MTLLFLSHLNPVNLHQALQPPSAGGEALSLSEVIQTSPASLVLPTELFIIC